MDRSALVSLTARIVIVDDDDHLREATEMVLTGAGHSVRATGNGFEALRWLDEEPCDLLILDLCMPEIDGLALLREVQARWPTNGPRVLMLSGSVEPYREKLSAPVLVKPFRLDDLCGAVARVLTSV